MFDPEQCFPVQERLVGIPNRCGVRHLLTSGFAST